MMFLVATMIDRHYGEILSLLKSTLVLLGFFGDHDLFKSA